MYDFGSPLKMIHQDIYVHIDDNNSVQEFPVSNQSQKMNLKLIPFPYITLMDLHIF